MTKSNISELEFQLRKLIVKYSGLFAYHQWPSEHERWVELIFALISRISDKPEYEVRDIIEKLDDYGLLDVAELSNIPEKGGTVDFSYPFAKRVIESLSESGVTEEGSKRIGFEEEVSKRNLLVMHEAAKSLMEHHDGKIQKYFRKYGRQMVDEFADNFSFSGMDERDSRTAVTYWLQNVLNMPIHLETESMDTFYSNFQTTNEELVKEADKLDINIAILDDMIDQHIQNIEMESNQDE